MKDCGQQIEAGDFNLEAEKIIVPCNDDPVLKMKGMSKLGSKMALAVSHFGVKKLIKTYSHRPT
jgi:hypothetical protein